MKSVVSVFRVFALSLLLVRAAALLASDHADPMVLEKPYANITGLFFFPKGDQMIFVFNVRRALTAPKPYPIEPYEYVIHLDHHTKITFGDEDRARYGGAVPDPSTISEDLGIHIRLNKDVTFKDVQFKGFTNAERIVKWTGVRDDPFIFPRFFKKNVISMIFSIPKTSFPPDKHDYVIWGSVYENGKQIDHVGRSNRSQLGRFDTLNPLPPTEHLGEIMKLKKKYDDIFMRLNKYKETQTYAGLVQYVLQIRKYDMQPDVMIYSDRYPPGFPNGRQLPDDIVGLTCAQGDCILQELAFVEGGWPRQTVNDKPFSDQFPFLAEPWPDNPDQPPPVPSVKPRLWTAIILFILIFWILPLWIAYALGRKRGARIATA